MPVITIAAPTAASVALAAVRSSTAGAWCSAQARRASRLAVAVIPGHDLAASERVEREQMAARLDAGARDRDVARPRGGETLDADGRGRGGAARRQRCAAEQAAYEARLAVEHDHERVDRRQVARAVAGKDAHELDARAVEAAAVGGHDVDEAVGARMDGRLRRQLDRALGQLDEHGARERSGLGRRRQQRRDLGVAQPARLRRGHCAVVVACERTNAASSRARSATRARSGSGSSRIASPR